MGPLQGYRVIEFAGIGPGPFCGMLLADLGAEVIRLDRPGDSGELASRALLRGRESILCDLKSPEGLQLALRLVDTADALIEGYRPGVMERLGAGPDVCLQNNPRLVYGRMTGWGQTGPLAQSAGHDINYIAISGALHAIGREGGKPVPPLNLVGDFAGGGLMLAFGIVSAMLHAQKTGQGQVVDAAMVDGANTLMAVFHTMLSDGIFEETTGSGFLGGAAHYYDTYETKDGKYISIAALEPQFYEALIQSLQLDRDRFEPHRYRSGPVSAETKAAWRELKAELEKVFKTRTRDEWCEELEGTDVCFAPVLTLGEVADHRHNKARNAFVSVGGESQPAPAPRFSLTSNDTPSPAPQPGRDSGRLLKNLGYSDKEIAELKEAGAIG